MAQEQSTKGFYDFMYGKYLLKDYFDITLHEDDYVERAYGIFRDIGNIATSIHSFEFTVDSDLTVDLPCNVEFIDSVSHYTEGCAENTILWHADDTVNPNSFLPDVVLNPNASRIDMDDQDSHLHPKGEFMPYELGGRVGCYSLKFDESKAGLRGICIYRGICVDPDGNPLLTRKEAEAIAYKMAFIDTQKKAFMGDPAALNRIEYIKLESGRKMTAAKIPEYVSQNGWNRMLSAMTRHDRKVFWSSYKTMQ